MFSMTCTNLVLGQGCRYLLSRNDREVMVNFEPREYKRKMIFQSFERGKICTAHLGTVGELSGLVGTLGTGRDVREDGVRFAPEDGRGGGGCLLPLKKEKQLQVYWKCSYKHYKSKSQTCNLWSTTKVDFSTWYESNETQIHIARYCL